MQDRVFKSKIIKIIVASQYPLKKHTVFEHYGTAKNAQKQKKLNKGQILKQPYQISF